LDLIAGTRLKYHTQPPVTALLLTDRGYAPGDRRSLPDPETLQAVQGYPLLRTDQNGWIELTTDGEQMWVEVERK
jgi:hypothetical protein